MEKSPDEIQGETKGKRQELVDKINMIKDKLFCDYFTHSTGVCGMYLFNGGSRCVRHKDKVSKVKVASPKFRGKSKTWEGFKGAVE